VDRERQLAALRRKVERAEPQLLAALDAFIESRRHYHAAELALQAASRRFARAELDQRERLAELEQLLTDTPGVGTAQQSLYVVPAPRDTVAPPPETPGLPSLQITCFGRFEVRRGGRRIELCQNRNGQTILRYLAAQPRHRESADVLMEVLWPEDPPDVARHKLHVASSALRRALNGDDTTAKGCGYLLYENGTYRLNDAATIAVDADEFMNAYRAGLRAGGTEAIPFFEAACRLYSGPFLSEDLYVDWPATRREELTRAYLTMCGTLAEHSLTVDRYGDAATWALALLDENRCDEAAYRLLMRAYAAEGRRGDAVRLFRQCQQALAVELGVEPMPETTALFNAILAGTANGQDLCGGVLLERTQ
jgi:DNA-binding SARP family transcriptional activator